MFSAPTLASSVIANVNADDAVGGSRDDTSCLAFSPDGSEFMHGSSQGHLTRWGRGGQMLRKFPNKKHEGAIGMLSYATDGQSFMCGSSDGMFRHWGRDGYPVGQIGRASCRERV